MVLKLDLVAELMTKLKLILQSLRADLAFGDKALVGPIT